MIELNLEIDGKAKSYNIPAGWDEVTLGQAADMNDLKDDDSTVIVQVVKLLKILAPDINEDDIMMMSPEQFTQVTEALQFVSDEVEGELVEYVEIEGEKYYLKKDFEKLTMGEIISIDSIMKQTSNDITKALPKVMCIFLRKKNDDGELESFRNSFMEREEAFRSIIITDVYKLFAFFLDGEDLSQNSTQESSPRKKSPKSEIGSKS